LSLFLTIFFETDIIALFEGLAWELFFYSFFFGNKGTEMVKEKEKEKERG